MEMFDLYTANRVKTGETMVRGHEVPQGYYRLVVHVCIFNSKGEMLIQQRQKDKEGWPNLWDVSVGGSVIVNESSQQAASRELFEELGIRYDFTGVLPKLTTNFGVGFDETYCIHLDVDLNQCVLQTTEVQAVKWANRDEIFRLIDQGEFIPYYKSKIQLLFDIKHHLGAIQDIKEE